MQNQEKIGHSCPIFLNIKKERPCETVIADYGDEVIDGGDKGS